MAMCFAVADVFLFSFLLCLPHVVLVVGTYQGITDRFVRRYHISRQPVIYLFKSDAFCFLVTVAMRTTQHKQPFGKCPL